MSISSGSRLGPYEVVAPIGAGGMGEVYRARDTKLKREVAVKVLPSGFAGDPERMARFQREAEVLASLNHPNIAHIYGVEDRALVMELVEGESPKGPLSFEDAWKIMSQVAAALEYAHDQGIVHRDLKPANIKVTPDGVVKLLDFGLAKAFSGRPDGASGYSSSPEQSPTLTAGATSAGMILGTAAYMSPEQARGKAVDRRADIWSFGVVLYELLTGDRLFKGEDVTETLASVVKDQPDLSRVPSKARGLLEHCLEKDPKKRLRDIGDAALLVEGPAAGLPAAAAPSRAPALAWGVAALLLISTAALGFVHLREKPPAAPAPVRFDLTPPGDGTAEFLALSPDGTKLAMVVQGADGQRDIWLRSMDSLASRKLTAADGSTTLAWSPDGHYLAFSADGKIKKIDVSGGAPETIGSHPSPFYGLTWSRQDVIVYSAGYLIYRVNASGGEPVALTQLDAKRGDVGEGWPDFLPDQRHFLYFLAGDDKHSGVYIGSVDAAPDKQDSQRLIEADSNAVYTPGATPGSGNVLYLKGDALMARPLDPDSRKLQGEAARITDTVGNGGAYNGLFTVSANGILATSTGGSANRQLTWYDRTGKVQSRTGDPDRRDEMGLSPDGKFVAEGRADAQGTWVVWLLDLARGSSSRFTFDNNGAGNAIWSSDGSMIAYAAGGGRSADIFRRPSNGATRQEVLYHSDTIKTPLDWSSDGKWLLYMEQGKDTRADLWVLPDPGGPANAPRNPVAYLVTPFNELQAKFSPDGKWVVYTSNESGTSEIYVRPFPSSSGGKWLVSSGGGGQARWRPDGKELLYFTPDGTLMSVPVTTGAGAFQSGTPKALFRASVMGGLGGGPTSSWRWDISRDGQRFLINTATDEKNSAPVTVTTNWPGLLRK